MNQKMTLRKRLDVGHFSRRVMGLWDLSFHIFVYLHILFDLLMDGQSLEFMAGWNLLPRGIRTLIQASRYSRLTMSKQVIRLFDLS